MINNFSLDSTPKLTKSRLMQGFTRTPKVFDALIPLVFLIVLLALNIQVFGTDGLSGSNQIVLILSSMVAAFVAIFRLGFNWETTQAGVILSSSAAMSSFLLVFLILALPATCLLSGSGPVMMDVVPQLLAPGHFLVAASFVSVIVF